MHFVTYTLTKPRAVTAAARQALAAAAAELSVAVLLSAGGAGGGSVTICVSARADDVGRHRASFSVVSAERNSDMV